MPPRRLAGLLVVCTVAIASCGSDRLEGAAGWDTEEAWRVEEGEPGQEGAGQDASGRDAGVMDAGGEPAPDASDRDTGPLADQGPLDQGEESAPIVERVREESPGDRCETGGQRTESGPDTNGDGLLGDDEVIDAWTVYECNPDCPMGASYNVDAGQCVQDTTGPAQLSLGWIHSCIKSDRSGVKCWGDSASDQLGSGTTNQMPVSTPISVVGLPSSVLEISSGWFHTCSLTLAHGVKCWGSNAYGQLGNGTEDFSEPLPVDAALPPSAGPIAQISAGFGHTCARSTRGGVWCWGANNYGVLGTGTGIPSNTPRQVSGLPMDILEIQSSSRDFNCALTSSGALWCWGQVIGQGVKFRPQRVDHAPALASLDVGGLHICGLDTDGAVWCWGANSHGQLGEGTLVRRDEATPVRALTARAHAVTSGYEHTCALTDAGGVWCWGSNSNGQLGDGTTTTRSLPVPVVGLGSGVESIAAGAFHTCAVMADQGVMCWGNNSDGQLGENTQSDAYVPVKVVGL